MRCYIALYAYTCDDGKSFSGLITAEKKLHVACAMKKKKYIFMEVLPKSWDRPVKPWPSSVFHCLVSPANVYDVGLSRIIITFIL